MLRTFFPSPCRPTTLVAAVRAAIALDASARHARADAARLQERFASLTLREREVLDALASGKLNKQIAADLGIVEQTVKFHRAHIMEKMHAGSVAELMLIVARIGVGDASVPRDEATPPDHTTARPVRP